MPPVMWRVGRTRGLRVIKEKKKKEKKKKNTAHLLYGPQL